MSDQYTQLQGEVYDGGLAADGASKKFSMSRTKALRVVQAQGPGYESSSRGKVYQACSATAGIAPGTALGTSAQALVIFNPAGSGVNASIKRLTHAYKGGTFALGNWVLARYSTIDPPTNARPGGTACVANRCDGTLAPGAVLVFSAATLTAAPIIHEPLDWVGVIDGTGATQTGFSRVYERDGSDILVPGTGLVMTYIGGAGTSPLCIVGARWEEIPIASS